MPRNNENLKKWKREHYVSYSELSEEDKEKRRVIVRRYRTNHPERVKQSSQKSETKRVRNKELTNKTAAALRLKKKLMVLDRYGGKCKCCGEKDFHFLSIDHIDGGGNQHRKAIHGGGVVLYAWLIRNKFPGGYQVLCFNCNLAKGIYGVCPHGR